MRFTEFGVTVSKMVSDRNFGNERTEIHLGAEPDELDDPEVCLRQMREMAREQMLADLRSSRTSAIRSELQDRVVAARVGDDEAPF